MYDMNSHQDEYCLPYYERNQIFNPDDNLIFVHQTFLYCLRTSEANKVTIDDDFKNTIDPSFTFGVLKEQNITSNMLLGWSASIELAERYEIFLKSDLNSLTEKETLFHNCISPWFGPLCRFTFDYRMNGSFTEIVMTAFRSKWEREQNAEVPCYQHLNCQTKLTCLDWREICNGKSECLDGSDENDCWQLEINQCNDNEFRCHNGLCIPIGFFHDRHFYPDCLDGTDETQAIDDALCYIQPSVRCEEQMCRPGQHDFSCGDGHCTDGIFKCSNGRSAFSKADLCSNATACSMKLYHLVNWEWCEQFCPSSSCKKDNCPMLYQFSYIPLLFGHVRLVFSNESVESGQFSLPEYVCYDEKLCPNFVRPTKYFNNLTCQHFNLSLKDIVPDFYLESLVKYIKTLFVGCLARTNEIDYCNYSTMYRCQNSTKCISRQRLLDGIRNCPFNDDETYNESCSLNDIRQRFRCYENGHEKCFASLVILDSKKDCINGEDERTRQGKLTQTDISFRTICDRTIDLLPILIDEQNETDETKCEHWPCNNTYTRCDHFWSCDNGADDINCPMSTCPALHHSCVFPNNTSIMSCLPIAQAGDGVLNCLGGTDEPKYAFEEFDNLIIYYFQCRNDSKYIHKSRLCNNERDCQFNDDESFCRNFDSYGLTGCRSYMTNVELFFCTQKYIDRVRRKYFKLQNMKTYPLQLTIDTKSMALSTWTNTRSIRPDPAIDISSDYAWRCNRGVSIKIRVNGDISKLYCLCPPSYYGDRCEYQNQRVSLTVQIRVSSDWYTIFIFLITLIDNERNIQSHDHIEYLPIRECRNKFNLYLLYSTRPKNSSNTYSVQIDTFNQFTLNYRASWIFPLRFSFLPVHRLPVLLEVPMSNIEPQHKCRSLCLHGHCFAYINDPSSTFCRCESGWSGIQCDVEYKCDCAPPDSICISDSICLCPPGRFGIRCHLYQYSSYSEPCLNGGYYLPKDIRYLLSDSDDYICICTEGYVGKRCQNQQERTRIDISLHNKLTIPSSVIIHFIAVQEGEEHNRTSTMKKIGFDQYSLIVYTSLPFNIALIQMFSEYYLIVLQEQTIVLANISTKIIPSHRCRSIVELFNQTLVNQHLLKRIKYYHIPCKEQLELVCFYDEVHFCLCNLDRHANCFEFDHNMDYTCRGSNFCQNEGLCFQDDPKCPTPPSCGCRQCYFGSRCQFSTKGSTLSLDTILGYHIHPTTEISQQPITVKVVIALTTFMSAFGFLNSFLAFETFKGQETRKVGCGLYLFASSIISLIIVIIFTVKFCLFLTSQIGSIQNRSFVKMQCVFIDYFIRCLLSISDWLSACVAIERAVNVSKGVNFNKTKSKQMAKWIILIVLLFTSCTYIYDPLHRRLIFDEEEERTWCVHKYSSSVQILDWIMNIFHFLVPFSINCISALIVIITAARSRSNSQKKKSFKEQLREQLQNHKHLLISPSVIVVLALPRLVLTFLSGCMKTARESWLYLIGYFISFVPPMVTFVVFVLPSAMYKKQFIESMKRIWQR